MKVALLGYGNVGGGAYDIICEMKGGLAVKHILARSIRPGMEAVMTTDFKDILNDEEIDIVAETIGGLHPAYEYVTETSLDKGTQRKTTENELPSLTQCTA